jgi:Xaa-Pro aminopeptidase
MSPTFRAAAEAAGATPPPDLTTLPAMDLPARLERLRIAFGEAGIDALLVTDLLNVRYLTGFSGSAGLLAVTDDRLTLVTDGRYGEQAPLEATAAGATVDVQVAGVGQKDLVRDLLGSVTRLGLEAEHVTWAQQRAYTTDWFPEAELVATEGLVAALREVKDDGEVARLAAASAIADAALAVVRPMLLDQPTEAEVALALDSEMRRLGATGPSFETIVASGPNGARPHARPGSRTIVEGDLVVTDFGALVDGYHSDMTRTHAVGDVDDTQQRMLDVVAESQAAGVAAVRAGATVKDVDRACRQVIEDAGWGDAFVHGTGHGVGLEIHEGPRVSSAVAATLAAGHVVTVEPGVYLPEHGGVRIEDTVVVTADGCDTITLAPKTAAVA